MNKSLSEQLGEVYDKLEGVSSEPVEIGSEPVETMEEPGETLDRTRDESGRFAKEPRETLKLREGPKRDPKTGGHLAETKPQEGAEPAVEAKPVAEKPVVEKETIAPPAEWSGGAKVSWERLPFEVKKELSEGYKTVAAAKAIHPVLEPYIDAGIEAQAGLAPYASGS